ncbi:MAG: CoA ester lyase [Alphaproteobacteria bacterium]|nr:CoA ester lyase [Alphaproteobacteria bacterium]
MAATIRPRRSVLYVPGSNPRALEKARTLSADALILDLEDAIAPDAKLAARQGILDALEAGGWGRREILVRVNGLESEWGRDDVAAMAGSGADAILLPKVESVETIRDLEALLAGCEAPAGMVIWCMIETPLGVLHAEEIARASPRLGGYVMGTSDLAKDLHCLHTPDRLPVLTSLSLCILAARAHGLAILDGVHLDLDDDEGFAASCRQGLELGFDGKTLIHPRTIDTANTVFAPSADELDWSERIIAAHSEAAREGRGVVVVDGRLVENLHIENARRILSLAAMITELESASG